MVKAIIMAGGEGTRLRPLTSNRAKPMTPVVNKPVIEHAVDLLREHAITDIVISLFYLPDNVQNYFGDGSDWDVNISYSVEENPLGTAGGVGLASQGFDDTFLVLSGDGIIDFDLSAILAFHKEKSSAFTIALKRVSEPTEYGIVITDTGSGRIKKFLEKPSWSEVFSDTANTGVYVIEPSIIKKYIPQDTKLDFSFDLFPLLQKENIELFGYITDGFWCDVGTIDSYLEVHRDILDQLIDLHMPGKMIGDRIWVGKNVEIEPGARLKGPIVLGDFVKVRANAEVSDFSVIGNNCVIEVGASIRRSVVLNSTVVGPKAELRGCIVGKRCFIEESVSILERAVVSDDCQIGSHAEVPAGIRVWPDKFIEHGTRLTSDLIWGQSEKKTIFSISKIIGSFNVKITPEFSAKLGSALGAYLGKNTRVAISRDASGSSRLIKRAITSGLLSMGVDAFDLEIESTPVTRFSSRFLKADLSIHVETKPQTGLQYIVIHLFDKNGFQLQMSVEKKIESIFYRGDYPRKSAYEVGQLHYSTHHLESYMDDAANYIDMQKLQGAHPPVIVDCSNGAASYIFPDILSYFGVIPTTLRGQVKYRDVEIDIEAEMSRGAAYLQNMCASNNEIGAMISLTGSHIFIYDEKGVQLNENEVLLLLCLYYARYKGATSINLPVNASRVIDDVVKQYGASVIRISTKFRSPEKGNEIFGVTDEGVFPTLVLMYDVLISFLMILELTIREHKTLADLRAQLPQIRVEHIKLECTQSEKAAIMREMTEAAEGDTIELTDGVRIVRDQCWLLILPDGSLPIIHIYAEGQTDICRDTIVAEYTKKIKGMRRVGRNYVHN